MRAASSPTLSSLGTVTEGAIEAVAGGDREAFSEAVREAAVLLGQLGDDLELPIVTPGLERLVAIADEHGIPAKPSGAGAGDCAVAFASDPEAATALRDAWSEADFMPLPVGIGEEGVRVE